MDIFKTLETAVKMASNYEDHAVYDKLGDLKIELYKYKEEIVALKEENLRLKNQLSEKETLTLVNECYYFNDDGPFCSRCYDVDGKKVRMQCADQGYGTKYNVCPQCKNRVVIERYDHKLPNKNIAKGLFKGK